MRDLRVFVGYDEREAVAYHVCVNSLIRRSSLPLSITPLALGNIARFYDEKHTDASNAFGYTRFLVPYLSRFSGMAIYLDGDMVVRDDPVKMLDYCTPGIDVAVVKHDYTTQHPVKYLGAKNPNYPRKNWSSVMVFNCYTSACMRLTPEYVAKSTGAHLHRFEWTTDERIGDMPLCWNWLCSEYSHNDDAKILHYTIGVPAFKAYSTAAQSDMWFEELHRTTSVSE